MEKKQVVVKTKVLSTIKKITMNSDIIVSDSKPDIVSIINSNGIAYLNKENNIQDKFYIDGILDVNIVYLSDIGDTRSLSSQITFSEIIEDKLITEDTVIKTKVLIDTIDVKILNERKVSLEASINLKVDVYKNEEIIFLDNAENSEDCITEKLKEDIEVKSLVGSNKTKVNLKENISSKEDKKILEIVKTNIEVLDKENKISYNKILTKADCKISCIYLNEECKIGKLEETFPIMSFIDIEKIEESNFAEIDYSLKNLNLKVNNQNESQINAQIEFEIKADIFVNKKVEIIQDMYGINKNISYIKKDVKVNINSIANDKYTLKEQVSLDKNISNIYLFDCFSRIIKKDNNIIEGEMNLNIYFEADEKIGLNVKRISLPFMINNKVDNIDDFSIEIINKNITVSGENVDIFIEYKLNIEDVSWRNISIIENVEFEEMQEENTYKMYMYFVKPGDTIWRIAKKYKIKLEDLLATNNLDNSNKINVGDKIYIMK